MSAKATVGKAASAAAWNGKLVVADPVVRLTLPLSQKSNQADKNSHLPQVGQ